MAATKFYYEQVRLREKREAKAKLDKVRKSREDKAQRKDNAHLN